MVAPPQAGAGQAATRRSDALVDILLEEWKHCEAGIARYDALQFQIRGWAISTVAAIVAATVTLQRWEIAVLGMLVALLFWWNEAVHDTYKALFIRRVRRVQRTLRRHNRGQPIAGGEVPGLARSFDAAWEKKLPAKIRDTLESAAHINLLLTYVALLVLCGSAGLVVRLDGRDAAGAPATASGSPGGGDRAPSPARP